MRAVWVSLSALGVSPASRSLARLWSLGVRHVELAIGPLAERGMDRLVQEYQRRGVEFRAHHAFALDGPSSTFDLVRSLDEDEMRARLDWLAENGIKVYSVHAGSYDEGMSRAEAYEVFLSRLAWLTACCAERGIRLGVETMFAMPPSSRRANLLVGLDEIDRFLRDAPEVPLVVDMAHLNIWPDDTLERRLEVFRRARGRVLEVHVSDNDGRRDLHTLTSERSWWWPFREVFPDDAPIVIESRVEGSDERLRSQLGLLSSGLGGAPQGGPR